MGCVPSTIVGGHLMLNFFQSLQPNNYFAFFFILTGLFLFFTAFKIRSGDMKFSTICQGVFPNKYIDRDEYLSLTMKYNARMGLVFCLLGVIGQFIYEPWMFFLTLMIGMFILIFEKGRFEIRLNRIIQAQKELKKSKKGSSRDVSSPEPGTMIKEFVE
jgi:hypothetical protein